MPNFNCTGCGKTIGVPDQYAGKRVKCPGCQAPQRVPAASGGASVGHRVAQTTVDLSSLDDTGASGVRRLRQILIGCGACQKTIKLPEGRMGGNTPCPKCKTVLRFDRFDLSRSKGDLIDMTHLELEPGDPLMDTGGYGSTLGGSAVQFGSQSGGSAMGSSSGTATGYALNHSRTSSAGLGGSSSDSQTQMRELKELNELKHSGAISSDEYKRRKAEIYSGKTLALQAMSRSADGNAGSRPVLGRVQSGMSTPVKALIGVSILGLIAAVVYGAVLQGGGPGNAGATENKAAAPSTQTAAVTPPIDDSALADGGEGGGAGGAGIDEAGDGSADTTALTGATDGGSTDPTTNTQTAGFDLAAGMAGLHDLAQQQMENGGDPVVPIEQLDNQVSMVDPQATADPPPVGVAMTPDAAGPPTQAPVEMRISEWPVVWQDYSPSVNQPIVTACEIVKRVLVRSDSALIGVAAGPPTESMTDPRYTIFRQGMIDILMNAADAEGIRDSLIVRDKTETFRINQLECQVLHATMSGRNDRATILTTIQDGYTVAYWFAGSRRAYPAFLDTVGKAVLSPKL